MYNKHTIHAIIDLMPNWTLWNYKTQSFGMAHDWINVKVKNLLLVPEIRYDKISSFGWILDITH